jgi:hypothetical protein
VQQIALLLVVVVVVVVVVALVVACLAGELLSCPDYLCSRLAKPSAERSSPAECMISRPPSVPGAVLVRRLYFPGRAV